MDNILKDIKELIKSRSISAFECFLLVLSIHISLLLSKQREDYITIILSKIPNSNFSILVIFAAINYILTYKMEIEYLEVLKKTALNQESKEYEKQFEKNYLKKHLKTFYFIIIAYFISLFKFYEPKYVKYYAIIFFLLFILEKSISKILNLKNFIKSTFKFIFKH